MPRISIDVTSEMFDLLRRTAFDMQMPHAVYVRELIRADLEARTGQKLNQQIGPPGRVAGAYGVLADRRIDKFGVEIKASKPTVDLAKGIAKLLDQPLPPRTFQELCQSVIGADESEVRDALVRLGKAISESGEIY